MRMILRAITFGCLLIFSGLAIFADTAKIEGKVRDENGKALTGVTIKANRTKIRTLDEKDQDKAPSEYEVKSDDKGIFIFTGLAAGSYALTFEMKGFKTATTRQRVELTASGIYQAPKPFELRREDPFSLIRGAVLDTSGYSLPNVSITLERLDEKKFKKLEKNSTDGGEFAFRLPSESGKYLITASATGFVTASKEISIDSSEIRQVVLQLEKKK
jgi:Carboxypeptidase regulatory-like domain